MNPTLPRALRLLSSWFGFLLFFPIEVVLLVLPPRLWRGSFGTPSALAAIGGFLLLYGLSLLGRGCAALLDQKLGLSALKRRMLSLLPALVCAAGVFAAVFALSSPIGFPYEATVMGALAFAAFFTGSALWFYAYDEVITTTRFLVTSSAYVVALAALSMTKQNTVGVRPFTVLLLTAAIALLFGLNQSGMDGMMQRRKHRADQLPQRIRGYNVKLVALVAVALLLLLLLYRPLAAAIAWIGNALWALLKLLLQWLTRDRGSADAAPPPAASMPVQEPSLSDQLGTSDPSPFWNYFGGALLIILLGVLIYNAKRIGRAIERGLRRFWTLVQTLLHREHVRHEQTATEDYVDTEESVALTPDDTPAVEEAAPEWRRWKRDYRRYTGMPGSPERLRAGYRLMLGWLQLQEVPLRASDTTLEIARSAEETLDFTALDAATEPYNLLRYGNRLVDLQDIATMNQVLSEMAQTKTAAKRSRLSRAARAERNG